MRDKYYDDGFSINTYVDNPNLDYSSKEV